MARTRLLSVSGIDGSGKTTIIDELTRVLREDGNTVHVIWLRYNHYLTKAVLALGRLLGYTVFEDHPDCRVSYHEFYRSKPLSHAFIALTWLDTAITSFITVYSRIWFSDSVVICDRWIPDILIDLEIDTHFDLDETSTYGKLFWFLVPRNARLFVVARGYDSVLDSRPEHRYDRNLKPRFELYAQLAADNHLEVIDNTGPLDETLRQTVARLKNLSTSI